MSKQDRQGARTVADLERRLNTRKTFAEAMGLAKDAKKVADEAMEPIYGDSPDGVDSALFVILGKNSTVKLYAFFTWASMLSGSWTSAEYQALMNVPGCRLMAINPPCLYRRLHILMQKRVNIAYGWG